MKVTKEVAPLLGAAAATLPFAYLGNRFVDCAYSYSDMLEGLTAAPTEMWGYIAAHPFRLLLNDAGMLGMLLGVCIPWAIAMVCLVYGQKNTRVGEEHGSARWATTEELAPFIEDKNPQGSSNALLLSKSTGRAWSREGFSMNYDGNMNVLVIGGSGAGKTRYYVKPNVCQMNSDLFITDPKGDLLLDVGNMLTNNGYEIRSFNTFFPDRSLIYNPLHYVRTDLEIQSFAGLLISMTTPPKSSSGDPFWEKSEKMLYMALIAFMRDYCPAQDYNIGGLLKLLSMAKASESNENYKSPLDLIFDEIETGMRRVKRNPKNPEVKERAAQNPTPSDAPEEISVYTGADGERFDLVPSAFRRHSDNKRPYDNVHKNGKRGFDPTEDYALENYRKFQSAAGKTLKSILITCNARLAPFTAAEVKQLVVGEDQMHLERFGDPDSKNAIFAIFDDTDQRTLGFLHGMMVYQTVRVLCHKALEKYNGKLPRPVNFILDEYRSLSLPADISGFISVLRSRNIAMSVILQAKSQLAELYDEATADSIVGCCDTVLYLGGGKANKGTTSTCEFISDSCGQQTVFQENYSQSHGGQGSWSKSGQTVGRALIDPAEVAKLPKTECIVLINGANPIVDEKYPLTEHPNYRMMADTPGFDIKKYMAEKRRREEREYSAILASQSKSMPRRMPLRGRSDAEVGKHYKSRDTDSTGKAE